MAVAPLTKEQAAPMRILTEDALCFLLASVVLLRLVENKWPQKERKKRKGGKNAISRERESLYSNKI